MAKRMTPKAARVRTLRDLNHLEFFYVLRGGKKIFRVEFYQFCNPWRSKDIARVSIYRVELRLNFLTGEGRIVRTRKSREDWKWTTRVTRLKHRVDKLKII